MWIILALLSGAGAAVIATITKLYLKQCNALFIMFIFSLITTILLFVIDLLSNQINCKQILALHQNELLALFAAGTLHCFAFVCYLSALQSGQTGSVIALDRLGIIFALILAAIFLQESFSIKTIIGACLMIGGAVLISAR